MPLCVVCGFPLTCTHEDRHAHPLAKPCALKKGAIWVHVMDDAGASLEGVEVTVTSAKKTERSGFVRFDELESQRYTASLSPLSGEIAEDYDPPESDTAAVHLSQGEVAYLAFQLRRKATLHVTVALDTNHGQVFDGATVTVDGPRNPGAKAADQGIARYPKLSSGPYSVKATLKPADDADYFAPNDALPVVLSPGETEAVVIEIKKRPCPTLALSAPAIAVGGAKAKLTLGSDLPYGGKGQLTVTRGAAAITIVNLVHDKLEVDGVSPAGTEVEVTARDASALEGVEFAWKLTSDDVAVSAKSVQHTLTVVKAELKVETPRGVMASDVKHGDGAVVHIQNLTAPRKRLKVTPVCQPADYRGSLRITAIKGNVTPFDAPDRGNQVDLSRPIAVGTNMAPIYLEGNAVSDPVRDTGLQLSIVDLAPDVDHVKVTVVEVKLEVYGGTPGPSDPRVRLGAAEKRDPGRRIYVQNTDKWWWGRAKVQVLKNPPEAPCALKLRQSGDGTIHLFPEKGGGGDLLDVHVHGEAATAMPLDLAVDAIADAVAGLSLWAEGVTSSGRNRKCLLHLDLTDLDEDCDFIAFRVYPPLFEYDRINVIDLGGPGSGHQAAVLKLLASIATVGYAGDVVFSYNKKKTKIYASKLGKAAALEDPAQSYALYFAEWQGVIGGMNVRCLPIGALDFALTPAQTNAFTDVRTFWTQYFWPTVLPAPFTDPEPAQKFGPVRSAYNERKKWTTSNPNLLRDQQNFRQDKIYKQETGAAMAPDTDLVALDPVVDMTLSAFGAMDFHTNDPDEPNQPDFKANYFDRHWLPVLKRMTTEEHPVAMIFQPFLWSGGHPMQVRQDTRALYPVDVTAKVVAGGGKAAYSLTLPDPGNDDALIAALPTVAQAVLRRAKDNSAYLISAYYGGSVSDITYPNLLRVLVRVIKAANLPKKVMIALLGDEETTAHTTVATELADAEVVARRDDADSAPGVKVELAHIGRTTAMTQFERYSCLFVTEGANTWQELLTMGTVSVSVKPGGNTRPWDEADPTGPRGEVLAASNNLVASDADAFRPYFLKAIDQNSDVSHYFQAWAQRLQSARSDQVVTAINYLPDPDVAP